MPPTLNTPARPLDLRAPGALAELFEWRRSRHGSLRMEAGDGGTGDGGNGGGSGDPSGGKPGGDGKPSGDGKPGDGTPDGDGMNTDAGRRALAAERQRAEAAEAKVAAFERKGKTEVENLSADVTKHTARADAAESTLAKYEAGLDLGLTRAQCLRLTGKSPEELAADAKQFAKELGLVGDDGKPIDRENGDDRRGPGTGQPREQLIRGGNGGTPSDPAREMDPAKLAALGSRRSY